MSNVVTRTIFTSTTVERNWRNQITSAIVHIVVIGAAFILTFPSLKVSKEVPVRDHVTLLDPQLPRYRRIDPPRIPHTAKLTLPVIPPTVAKTIPPPVLPKPTPQPLAKVITPPPAAVPAPAPAPRIVAEAKPAPAPVAKPVVKTGAFEDAQMAKPVAAPRQLVVGGFGDPHGAQSSETPKQAPVLMAKVGSFESPAGAGNSGGAGRMDSGSVKQSGFGNGTVSNGSAKAAASIRTAGFGDSSGSAAGANRGNGAVRSVGFGDNTVAAAPQRRDAPTAAIAAFTPVEILFKPRPSYSSEARSMRLEGQVSLEVVFQASGAVKVVRVIRGLGHGLDEAAQQAAVQVRFKPATRSGAPVDTNATISITFELS